MSYAVANEDLNYLLREYGPVASVVWSVLCMIDPFGRQEHAFKRGKSFDSYAYQSEAYALVQELIGNGLGSDTRLDPELVLQLTERTLNRGLPRMWGTPIGAVEQRKVERIARMIWAGVYVRNVWAK